MSHTFFEPSGFILRETVLYAVRYVVCVCVYRCEQSGGQESVLEIKV
jgi:hypothetical protein